MNIHIKQNLLASLLIGTYMLTPQTAVAMDNHPLQPQGQEAPLKFNPFHNPCHALASALFIVPMWQCYRKSAKAQIPQEEEYSWTELGQSLKTLCHHYVTKPIDLIFARQPKYSNEQINNAAHNLWHNLKNLYNTGVVGQKKQNSILKADAHGNLPFSQSTPARGLCGNLLDMAGDAEAVLKKFVYFAGAYLALKKIYPEGFTIPSPVK